MHEHYKLMHGDVLCGLLIIEKNTGILDDYQSIGAVESAPFLGNADKRLMRKWWEARAVPASRTAMQQVIRNAGCTTSREYLAKNLALSMTDTYWICPVDETWAWKDINLLSNIRIDSGRLPYHNATSYDPNASLGGQMEKYWDLNISPPSLVKTAYQAFGQQAVNEKFATLLHERQEGSVPFVRYEIRTTKDRGVQAVCPSFVTESEEFIPAMEVIDSEKIPNDLSLYDAYINICSKHGIDSDYLQQCLDYQTLTDFIISNTDEHLMNFGILRNAESLQFTGPAPIFDSGNSMFYNEDRIKPYTRPELLARKITGFHQHEDAMLKHVKNRKIVCADLLPSPKETEAFYLAHGIPEEKAGFLSACYALKLEMLQEFQSGRQISLYHAKQRG